MTFACKKKKMSSRYYYGRKGPSWIFEEKRANHAERGIPIDKGSDCPKNEMKGGGTGKRRFFLRANI